MRMPGLGVPVVDRVDRAAMRFPVGRAVGQELDHGGRIGGQVRCAVTAHQSVNNAEAEAGDGVANQWGMFPGVDLEHHRGPVPVTPRTAPRRAGGGAGGGDRRR